MNQSGLLFMPRRWQKTAVIQWLKKIHAWTGFWGAILFLMMGMSGMLLNHRDILKIETGKPEEVSKIELPVAPALIKDEKSLGLWAQKQLGLPTEPRAPRKEGGPEGSKKRFLGKERVEAPKWEQAFNHVNGRVTVSYVPGSASVSVRQDAQNGFGLIKNLHKGGGVGVGWVLFLDTIAGALIMMSLTGFLLWTRLHGSRLVGGGIMIASVIAALSAIWPWLL